MNRAVRLTFLVLFSTVMTDVPSVLAESPSSAPASDPGQVTAEKLVATCIRVKGTVQYAPIAAKSTDTAAWKPVEVGQEYGEGVQIRTGVRSSALLKFGDDTIVMVDRSTLAAISEFRRTADTKRTRIGLDYGAVRAGVAEGGLRSDFAIDSPVATLSKRGTWDFEMWVERGTGRFDVKLADRGLVEVLHKGTGQKAQIKPKQHVTEAMLNWADTARFDRLVVLADAFGLTAEETDIYSRTNTGRTGLDPDGNTGVAPGPAAAAAGVAAGRSQSQSRLNTAETFGTLIMNRQSAVVPRGPVNVHEGDFGTGFGIGSKEAMRGRVFRVIPASLFMSKGLADGALRIRKLSPTR